MMILTQTGLSDWLDAIAERLTLVAPVSLGDKLLYRQVTDSREIAWGFERTDMSPKTHLFPATEPILAIEKGSDVKLRQVAPPRPKVVFGVRPCDARGLLAIDALTGHTAGSDLFLGSALEDDE